MNVVFSVCIARRGAVGDVYGKCECHAYVMNVCVLCSSCGSSQCCFLHDLHFVIAGR